MVQARAISSPLPASSIGLKLSPPTSTSTVTSNMTLDTPFPPPAPRTPSLVYGRVLVPSNGVSQLNLGDEGIKLGGAWRELQAKQESDNRERQRLVDRATAAVLQAERLGMENEDLTSQAVRLELKLSKAKMSDLTSETRADEVESENEALRIMHRNSVVDLEVEKARTAGLEAKLESLQRLADNSNDRARTLDSKVDEGEERFRDLREKLIRAEGAIKKVRGRWGGELFLPRTSFLSHNPPAPQLQTQLGDERKKSQLYLKLKDDKDAHINVLVKEKNRLHDTLQDMAKRHSMTSRR